MKFSYMFMKISKTLLTSATIINLKNFKFEGMKNSRSSIPIILVTNPYPSCQPLTLDLISYRPRIHEARRLEDQSSSFLSTFANSESFLIFIFLSRRCEHHKSYLYLLCHLLLIFASCLYTL